MRTVLLAAIVCFTAAAGPLFAQDCPKEAPNGPSTPSAAQSLSGTIVYHAALRHWTGLRLTAPVCGQSEIELIATGATESEKQRNWRRLETLRGCKATVSGTLDLASTGYYSTDIFQNADRVAPDASCVAAPPLPDYSHVQPNPSIRRYQAKLIVSYLGEGSIRVEARSKGRLLNPWQAYTSYFLTGEFGLDGYCAHGFQMTNVSGTPEAKPWQMGDENQALMDPESAGRKKIEPVIMTFTCTRPNLSGRKKPTAP